MNKLTAALAAVFLTASMLATASAEPPNHDSPGKPAAAHATASAHPSSSHSQAESEAAHDRAMAAHKRYAASHNTERRASQNEGRGNSATAHSCVNPAGHTRGWCKGNGTYRGRFGNRINTISGTVTAINGNVVTFLRDNGSTITVLDNNRTVLYVGGHYTLVGRMVNGRFVLGSTNDKFGQSNQTVSGTILYIGNGTVTLIGLPPTTINVQQAMNNGATNGSLTVGRSITAYGYYSNNIFYATAIQ